MYDGPDFEAYEVRRRGIEAVEDTLLAELTDAGDTTLIDQTLLAEVPSEYTVLVRVAEPAAG